MVNVYLGTSRVNWSIVIDGKLMQCGEHNVINHHLRMVKKNNPFLVSMGLSIVFHTLFLCMLPFHQPTKVCQRSLRSPLRKEAKEYRENFIKV